MTRRLHIILLSLLLIVAGYLVVEFTRGRGETHQITIIDIGNASRPEIGRLMREVAAQRPEIIGMDFFLVNDSLERDTVIAAAMDRYDRTIQVVALHRFNPDFYLWDSLEVSHSKFRPGGIGFANIFLKDSVLVNAVPMQQIWNDSIIPAFGLAIARKIGRVDARYAEGGFEDLEFPVDRIGRNYNRLQLSDILSGDFKKVELEGKIVLLGYLGPDDDIYYIDEDRNKRASGVEIHAAILEEALDTPK